MSKLKIIFLIISSLFLIFLYQNCSDPFVSNIYESSNDFADSSEVNTIEDAPADQDDSLLPEKPDEPVKLEEPVMPEEPVEPEAPESGYFIKNNQWEKSHTNFVKFGDHSSDDGFVSSQPGDNDAIKVTVKKGSHYGSGLYYKMPNQTREAWVSFCIRFSKTWTAIVGGKLPGFGGNSSPTNGGQGGNPSDGSNAWSARMIYGLFDTSTQSVPIGYYVYHTDYSKQRIYGDAEWWAPAPNRSFSQSARVKQNRWDSIKQHVKMNSPGKNNGVLEAWHNGKLVYQRTNFNFTNNESFREVYKFWLNIYYGGGATPGRDHDVYFDQINYSVGGKDSTAVNCVN